MHQKEGERQRSACWLAFRFPNSCNSQEWARLKPGARKSNQVSHLGTGAQVLGQHPSLTRHCIELDQKWNGRDLNLCSDMGCQPPYQQFKPLSHSTDLSISIYLSIRSISLR